MTEEQIIEQIHFEFDSASETLLIESEVKKPKDELAQKLRKAGFEKSERVVELEKNDDCARMRETVLYYQNKYPLYKFITPLQVEAICKKYGLFFGDVEIYTGSIPEKNVNEILNFELSPEDAPSKETGWISVHSSATNYDNIFLSEGVWCEKKIETSLDRDKKMKICAPPKDFKLNSWQVENVKDGFMIVLDPIVLQPVKGGYLIVSKWGLEASDSLVINPIEN